MPRFINICILDAYRYMLFLKMVQKCTLAVNGLHEDEQL